jgi:hypothetical protein
MGKRSDVRLGKDNERRLAKKYGWRKVGQFGDAVDLLGADVKVQSKATRHPITTYLDGLRDIGHLDIAPAYVTGPIEKMAPLYPDRIPVLVRSFVRRARPTRDFIYLAARHWYALHGGDESRGWVVMTGEYWLDIHGREGLNPPDRMV